jgi:hypothetical protein
MESLLAFASSAGVVGFVTSIRLSCATSKPVVAKSVTAKRRTRMVFSFDDFYNEQ